MNTVKKALAAAIASASVSACATTSQNEAPIFYAADPDARQIQCGSFPYENGGDAIASTLRAAQVVETLNNAPELPHSFYAAQINLGGGRRTSRVLSEHAFSEPNAVIDRVNQKTGIACIIAPR